MKTELQICRVCLVEMNDDSCQMNSIFELDQGDNIKLSDKLSDCCGFKIENENHLPGHICNECLNTLIISYDFRKLCQTTEKKLRIQCMDSKYMLDTIKLEVENIQPDTENDEFLINIGITLDNENEDLSNQTLTESPIIFKTIKKDISDEKMQTKSSVIKCSKLKKEKEEEKTFICEICGNIYNKKYQLRRHREMHTDIFNYECEICHKKFRLNNYLDRHMRSHTGQKPHQCKFCGRCFSDLSTKIKHERLHTGERPFRCETCGKAFTYSDVLKKHLLVHTGEKPFSCELCGSNFSRKHHLTTHLKSSMHLTKVKKSI